MGRQAARTKDIFSADFFPDGFSRQFFPAGGLDDFRGSGGPGCFRGPGDFCGFRPGGLFRQKILFAAFSIVSYFFSPYFFPVPRRGGPCPTSI
jgi:hypothetical protein